MRYAQLIYLRENFPDKLNDMSDNDKLKELNNLKKRVTL